MAGTGSDRALLHHVEAFNRFCKETYIENKTNSLSMSRSYVSAVKDFLEKDYAAVASFFNVETWTGIDSGKLARFKFEVN